MIDPGMPDDRQASALAEHRWTMALSLSFVEPVVPNESQPVRQLALTESGGDPFEVRECWQLELRDDAVTARDVLLWWLSIPADARAQRRPTPDEILSAAESGVALGLYGYDLNDLAFLIQAYCSLDNTQHLYLSLLPERAAHLIAGLTCALPPAWLAVLTFTTAAPIPTAATEYVVNVWRGLEQPWSRALWDQHRQGSGAYLDDAGFPGDTERPRYGAPPQGVPHQLAEYAAMAAQQVIDRQIDQLQDLLSLAAKAGLDPRTPAACGQLLKLSTIHKADWNGQKPNLARLRDLSEESPALLALLLDKPLVVEQFVELAVEDSLWWQKHGQSIVANLPAGPNDTRERIARVAIDGAIRTAATRRTYLINEYLQRVAGTAMPAQAAQHHAQLVAAIKPGQTQVDRQTVLAWALEGKAHLDIADVRPWLRIQEGELDTVLRMTDVPPDWRAEAIASVLGQIEASTIDPALLQRLGLASLDDERMVHDGALGAALNCLLRAASVEDTDGRSQAIQRSVAIAAAMIDAHEHGQQLPPMIDELLALLPRHADLAAPLFAMLESRLCTSELRACCEPRHRELLGAGTVAPEHGGFGAWYVETIEMTDPGRPGFGTVLASLLGKAGDDTPLKKRVELWIGVHALVEKVQHGPAQLSANQLLVLATAADQLGRSTCQLLLRLLAPSIEEMIGHRDGYARLAREAIGPCLAARIDEQLPPADVVAFLVPAVSGDPWLVFERILAGVAHGSAGEPRMRPLFAYLELALLGDPPPAVRDQVTRLLHTCLRTFPQVEEARQLAGRWTADEARNWWMAFEGSRWDIKAAVSAWPGGPREPSPPEDPAEPWPTVTDVLPPPGEVGSPFERHILDRPAPPSALTAPHQPHVRAAGASDDLPAY